MTLPDVSVFLLDRREVSTICGANFLGFGVDVAVELSIECDSGGGETDTELADSCGISDPSLFSLLDFLELLDDVSTGCGSGRRDLDVLPSCAPSLLEPARLLLLVSSIGCGRGRRDEGGELGAMADERCSLRRGVGSKGRGGGGCGRR